VLRTDLTQAGFSLGKGAVRSKTLDPQKLQLLCSLLRDVIAGGITC
jgi:hypothetical protein